MSARKILLVALAAIALAVAAIYAYDRSGARRDADAVRVSGNIEVTDAEVSFKIGGRVAERLVDEGDTVQAGQIVARLDSADLVQQAAQRRAEEAIAAAALAALVAGSRPEEIAQGVANLDRARADADHMQLEFNRMRAMLDRQLISRQDYDVADAANKSAQAAVRQLSEQLKLLKIGPRREDKDQARARLEESRQALALAETQLGYATVASPLSGLVLSKNVEPGEYVAPGTPVVTVGDITHPWLRAYISESDLGRVKVGQVVRVRTDSYPGKVYQGSISFIGSQAEFTPKNVQTQKERVKLVYRIKIEIPNPKMELKPGMPADAEIVLNGA